MALTDRIVNFEAVLRFDAAGNFVSAHRMPVYQVLDNGNVVARREDPPVPLTLAQIKTFVAAL